jgi:heat shock protein HslJ
VNITEPAAIVISTTQTPAACGQPTGSIQAAVTGGNGAYTYSWNTAPVQNSAQASGLSAGSYTLTGEGLTFGPIAGTRMACPPPLMETESAVYAAFARVTQFDFTPDGALLLKSDEATTLFTATR